MIDCVISQLYQIANRPLRMWYWRTSQSCQVLYSTAIKVDSTTYIDAMCQDYVFVTLIQDDKILIDIFDRCSFTCALFHDSCQIYIINCSRSCCLCLQVVNSVFKATSQPKTPAHHRSSYALHFPPPRPLLRTPYDYMRGILNICNAPSLMHMQRTPFPISYPR